MLACLVSVGTQLTVERCGKSFAGKRGNDVDVTRTVVVTEERRREKKTKINS